MPADPQTPMDEERDRYIEAMLTAFEREEPGIAEIMALYDDAVRHYATAAEAPSEVWTITSESSSGD